MTEIKLRIPLRAAELIAIHGTKNTAPVYYRFLRDLSLSIDELLTFGMLITPIKNNETEAIVGHVTYWEIGRVTVSNIDGRTSSLVKVIYWMKQRCPTPDECVQMYVEANNAA